MLLLVVDDRPSRTFKMTARYSFVIAIQLFGVRSVRGRKFGSFVWRLSCFPAWLAVSAIRMLSIFSQLSFNSFKLRSGKPREAKKVLTAAPVS